MANVFALALLAVAAGATASAAPAPGGDPCAGLARLAVAGATVVSADTVPAGGFTPPPNLAPWLAGDPSLYKAMPPFCRVVVRATPSADSDIAIEVWMPRDGWNERFRGQGNGGFAGEIDFRGMAWSVRGGYATAGTDTGHSAAGTDARWALGHPEKVTDFGHRAIHEMTRIAKVLVTAHYGRGSRHNYFTSCSNGGRQALMEAQRYPEDYDGIIAGAPANNWTRLLTKAVADTQVTTRDEKSYIPSTALPALAKAVNAACDASDGVGDGILSDPRQCRFDPQSMLCRDGNAADCLTAPQAKALKALYDGPRDAGGRLIFPGYPPGAEEGPGGWGTWITGAAPGKSLMSVFGAGYFTNMVYEQAGWDARAANVDEALKLAEQKTAQKLDATATDLSAFKARGGKLVLYHGWNDPAISALNTIDYYQGVEGQMGAPATQAFVRLYLGPGMQHCAGGPGPNLFGQFGPAPGSAGGDNISVALEQWVEKGTAPGPVVATKYNDDQEDKGVRLTRPLCPYPQAAAYKGQGDPNVAASFTCVAPKAAGGN